MFKATSSRGGGLNGLIGAGSHLNGELHFQDEFRIAGKITGTIVSPGELNIEEGGEVEGEVRVGRVYVAGTVRGSLQADQIEIAASGRVIADLSTPALTIESGAFFEGRCTMPDHPASKKEGERKNVAQMPIAKEAG